MIYSEAVEYISGVEKFGIKLGLDTVKTLLARLDNPQKSLKFLHIAGTNGKGSVSCFLTNILLASGYSVGTFNSPSVFGYNERYLCDNIPMSDDDVAKYVTAVADERAKMAQEGLDLPSAFELEFAVAMLYFKDKKCDFAVLECGLGGRLDATNAIEQKELAIITSISYDHTAILGDTLTKIAGEKFAIVKDCPLITYRQCDEVMSVLGKADDLILCEDPISVESNKDGQTMAYKGETYALKQLGKYQLINCSLAIESAQYLASKGYNITAESIRKGVAQSVWKGRLQKICKGDKVFLLDGAHNPDGAKVLAQELSTTFKDMKKCFVFGMFKDKD
ncbi:MAG: bifunctional folylpolyglutamate synthase/dihydrofolate synthase, partial [Clostridia bacterium]|nr:bifunctional folylpolyglutamate synthase/dihydrofolate synthase [Clostridia bacterium]